MSGQYRKIRRVGTSDPPHAAGHHNYHNLFFSLPLFRCLPVQVHTDTHWKYLINHLTRAQSVRTDVNATPDDEIWLCDGGVWGPHWPSSWLTGDSSPFSAFVSGGRSLVGSGAALECSAGVRTSGLALRQRAAAVGHQQPQHPQGAVLRRVGGPLCLCPASPTARARTGPGTAKKVSFAHWVSHAH